LTYSIIYEDEWIVGVNKSGNLLVHKSGASITKNLVYLLRHVSNNPAYEGIHSVNRLDRETSGIVLFTKSIDCLRLLHRDFAEGKCKKEYIAIVHGCPKEFETIVDLPIGADKSSAIHYKFRVDVAEGKPSSTHIRVIDTTGTFSLLSVKPITGRTHQIRVHLAAIGCTIIGDKLYGMDEASYLTWRESPKTSKHMLEFPRQALHCNRFTFTHPMTNETVTMTADLPADLQGLLAEKGLNADKSEQ
jgi:23S rRNA pseudouridine1911/1915/1917 synthase